jgi:hypothetical protein
VADNRRLCWLNPSDAVMALCRFRVLIRRVSLVWEPSRGIRKQEAWGDAFGRTLHRIRDLEIQRGEFSR